MLAAISNDVWPWAWATSHATPVDLAAVGAVLRDFRLANHLTQREIAERLSIHQSYVSKIERGTKVVHEMDLRLRMVQRLGIPARHVGLSEEMPHHARPVTNDPHATRHVTAGGFDPARESQAEWLSVRRHLNGHRSRLARLAVDLYEPDARIVDTPLITGKEWLPDGPVDLQEIDLEWVEGSHSAVVRGHEAEAQPVLPLRSPGQRFTTYTSAIRHLDPPTLFENRPSYRMLGVSWQPGGRGRMSFGLATYFDKLDLSEALGHEMSLADMTTSHKQDRRWRGLQFRGLVGDPFDFARRAIVPAITTLTLRRRRSHGDATFLLHWRDPSRVATAGGMYDVVPAGEFQPASIAPVDTANDFDLWRNMVREYSEELLGTPEHDGSGSTPLDYEVWPLFRALGKARAEGRVRPFCLGVGLDALTLAATILTVVVIDDDIFHRAFGDIVRANDEGIVVGSDGSVTEGIPFNERNVRRLLTREPLASPGAACLALAWKHRIALMAS